MKENRTDLILNYCKGKNVLDIGCIDHHSILESREDWLHKRIKSVAKKIVGIDYLKDEVEVLRKKGYDIVYANAEDFDLNEKFDVIVGGEILEHLSNPGNFLNSIKKHMHENTRLILTTPNAFSLRRMIGMILNGKLIENKEHVAYYSNVLIAQFFKRNGFKVKTIKYLHSEDRNKVKKFLELFLSMFFRKELRHTLFVVGGLIKK